MNHVAVDIARNQEFLIINAAMNEQPVGDVGELNAERLARRLDAPLDFVARLFIVNHADAPLLVDAKPEKIIANGQRDGLFNRDGRFADTRCRRCHRDVPAHHAERHNKTARRTLSRCQNAQRAKRERPFRCALRALRYIAQLVGVVAVDIEPVAYIAFVRQPIERHNRHCICDRH